MSLVQTLLTLVLVMTLTGCGPQNSGGGPGSPAASTGVPQVFVSNYPLQYMVERLAGDKVEVVFPVPGDEDPAYWKPDEKAIGLMQQCRVLFFNGATYEKWIKHVTLPDSRVVVTSLDFKKDWIQVTNATMHTHGPEGAHSHAGTAFTTWLDLGLALRQAKAVHAGLQPLLPDDHDSLQAGLTGLEADLTALDIQLKNVGALGEDRPLLGSHPVYQYLTRAYGLNLRSVHWEPGVLPADEEWTALATLQKTHPAKFMLWEGPPIEATVKKLEAVGIRSIVFDPCQQAGEAGEGDFLARMRRNVAGLEEAVK